MTVGSITTTLFIIVLKSHRRIAMDVRQVTFVSGTDLGTQIVAHFMSECQLSHQRGRSCVVIDHRDHSRVERLRHTLSLVDVFRWFLADPTAAI